MKRNYKKTVKRKIPKKKQPITKKHEKVIAENLFRKVFIVAVQKGTFEAVYAFLESEAANAI